MEGEEGKMRPARLQARGRRKDEGDREGKRPRWIRAGPALTTDEDLDGSGRER